ncbi:Choline kinase [Erysiphe neolycopersici]|uniref:Choline kinase n=1 Tax=Erysiphe neolycopersici TaxID=212602 RepID=A0A420HV59_9PEZI|nr:Choline kinase [Erysiphe neolycopersici]
MADLPLRYAPIHKHSSSKDRNRKVRSDVVPSCDVFLDNTKTVSHLSRAVESDNKDNLLIIKPKPGKNSAHWIEFKTKILKLAHTLRLHGWMDIPLEFAEEIEVEKVSGALTNAVYVISLPNFLRTFPDHKCHPKKHFSGKVLLRIYGHQFNHLIDRENELRILERLARKKIGPKMLGTFKNGRFEEYLNAETLRAEDIRNMDTSKQIAKRMRELHDGVELLEQERDDGPFVWRNWDKWADRCEEIMKLLDDDVKRQKELGRSGNRKAKEFICGVEWPQFKAAVEKYRKWLDDRCGKERIRQNLVFAHNDTQYGNILRLIPEDFEGSSQSPLLLPANTHKQLVVIDFEYASANTPGLEFANHFSEWCYNYHSPTRPWFCDTNKYPNLEEQTIFIESYVTHQLQLDLGLPLNSDVNYFNRHCSDGLTIDKNRSDINTNFGSSAAHKENAEQKPTCGFEVEKKVNELLEETRIWRAANSCQWVAWGIIQAQVPELLNTLTTRSSSVNIALAAETDMVTLSTEKYVQEIGSTNEAEAAECEDGFDYLSYALDRALFFWSDLLRLGIISKEELPSELVERLKVVDN